MTATQASTVRFVSINGVGAFEGSYPFQESTVEECAAWCKQQKILGVDTETEGFDFLTKRLIMFQIGNAERQYVIDTRGISIEPLREVLESDDIIKIFHNFKFDYKFIRQWTGIRCRGIWDTMVVEQVLFAGYENFGYALADLTSRYLGVTLDKSERNKFVGLQGQPYTVKQIIYGADDVRYLERIREEQLPRMKHEELEQVVELENRACVPFAEIEFNGITVDTDQWKIIAGMAKEELHELELELDQMLLSDPMLASRFTAKYVQTDLFTENDKLRTVSVKWSSPAQVLKVLKMLVPDLDSVGAPALNKFRKAHPLIQRFVDYQHARKRYTSYGPTFLNLVRVDGKVHTQFNQVVSTGRVSSSGPNVQQIPVLDKEQMFGVNTYRHCFIPGKKGWVFVSSDYASQELCVIAEKSKDPVWIEALVRGEDLHSICAELVFGETWNNAAKEGCAYSVRKQKCECPEHKKLRDAVKSINFGLAYGMTEYKLSNQMDIPVKEAKELIESYFRTFPKISGLLNFLGNFGTKNGYIKTFPPFMRRRYFREHGRAKMDPGLMGKIERASKNTPIQGSSADMTKLALIYISDYLWYNKIENIILVMTVHDQIDTICDGEVAEEWSKQIKYLMEEAAMSVLPSGRLKAEVNISERWEK